MTKTLLFLTLMLVAPVAGAELDQKQICSVMGCYDQPAEKGTILSKFIKATFLMNCRYEDNALVEGNSEKCPKKYWDGERKAKKLGIEQSDAEKWKDKCEEYLNIIDKPLNSKGAVRSIDVKQMYANLANAYCTRAILEEMRNK